MQSRRMDDPPSVTDAVEKALEKSRFRNRVEHFRVDHKLTIDDIARDLGVSRYSLRDVIYGRMPGIAIKPMLIEYMERKATERSSHNREGE